MILTHTNWLKMPARELGLESALETHGVGTTLLKRHKTLPHPRADAASKILPSTPADRLRDLILDTSSSSFGSDTSSPPTLKHASRRIGVPGLPPTPPSHSRDSSDISSSEPTQRLQSSSKTPKEVPSTPGTPPNQRSPPTPDVTPPRAIPALALRPPLSDLYASSRTESFKTARENPYSSDEDERSTVGPELPAITMVVEVPRIPERFRGHKEVGLGLGLESDEGTNRSRVDRNSQQDFVVFDGEWPGDASEVEREWDDNLMRNVTVRKRPIARSPTLRKIEAAEEVVEDDIVSPTNATKALRGYPLQDQIARHRLEKDTERLTRHERPPKMVIPDVPTTPNLRRFSAASARSLSSTVIEAMVVDGPPSRQKTLRHTKKHSGLRDHGWEQDSRMSAANSAGSTELLHKLVHKRSRIPEQRHRSQTSNATGTSSAKSKSRKAVLSAGGIPVVVIPDRQSSTRSSKPQSLRSTSSKKTRSMSTGSAPLSRSSKFNKPDYINKMPTRQRTMSESAGSGRSIRTLDYPPEIPTRRSSLSAPTSRNTSRAGSLTAESLKAHNLMQTNLELQKSDSAPVRMFGESEELGQSNRFTVDTLGDPFFGLRASSRATPFSQISYATSAAELAEAQAVSLYAHQNKSVLIIQQQRSSSQPPLSRSNPVAVHDESAAGPITPPQPVHPMDEVDSPLRNPRAPPKPPAIKFIPPTPAALSDAQEEDTRQLGYERPATSEGKPRSGLSLVRRAFSNRRRNSEPVLPEGFLSRAFSLSGRRKDNAAQTPKGSAIPAPLYPSVADRPAEASKLHPFWRPTRFWDDLEAPDDNGGQVFEAAISRENNRPILPKRNLSGRLKRTFAILPITDDDYYEVDRRTVRRSGSGNMRVVKHRSQSSLRRENSVRRHYDNDEPIGYGFKDGNGTHRGHIIPGLGIRVEYVGWGGVRRRMSERRRAQRSEKLRAIISTPREVQSGLDDVLRSRYPS